MRLPIDLVAYAIAFLNYAECDADVLAAFPHGETRERVNRVWLRHTRVERVDLLVNVTQRTFVNGVTHSVDNQPAVSYNMTTHDAQVRVEEWHRNGEIHRDGDLPAVTHSNGYRAWCRFGHFHRVMNDKPAIVYANGEQEWRFMDEIHRDGDRPAVVFPDGSRCWYRHGKRHRDGDAPAIEKMDGTRMWYKDGVLHRDGDAPAIVESNGAMAWYRNGKLHRDGDAPAMMESDGGMEWCRHGLRHRDHDRPAVMTASGAFVWYVNGEQHRDGDRPSYVSGTCQLWCRRDKLHRDGDRPAWIGVSSRTKEWHVDGKLHRDGDKPARINHMSCLAFYREGCFHRDKGLPAEITVEGRQTWHFHGLAYAEDNNVDTAKAELARYADERYEFEHWYVAVRDTSGAIYAKPAEEIDPARETQIQLGSSTASQSDPSGI